MFVTILSVWAMCGVLATFCMARVLSNIRAREEAQRKLK